jgi:hypothetical protein
MPTITVPERTLNRLMELAASRNVAVDVVIDRALDQLIATLPPVDPRTVEERLAALAAWQAEVEKRADRYPPDHVLDTDRERIYAERESP